MKSAKRPADPVLTAEARDLAQWLADQAQWLERVSRVNREDIFRLASGLRLRSERLTQALPMEEVKNGK